MDNRDYFKCSCCKYLEQRITGIMLMSGEFSYHMSLVHLLKPRGLHRESYLYESEDDLFKGNGKKIITRSSSKYHW